MRGGKPLAEAMVVFHPLEPKSRIHPKPMAYCDEQGRFQLMTYQAGDGAPAGRYAITVELRAPRPIGEEIVRDGPNTLPARYGRPETSPLALQVVEGDNEVPPLAIAER